MLEVELSCELLEFFAIEGWSIVSHDVCWDTFSQKQITQMCQYLAVVSQCNRKDEWELGEIIVGFLRVHQRADPWCWLHLFCNYSLADHVVQLFFDLRFVLDWHLASSVLHWWYTGVGFDVISARHVTYSIERVRKQGLQVPGTINLNAT